MLANFTSDLICSLSKYEMTKNVSMCGEVQMGTDWPKSCGHCTDDQVNTEVIPST